MSKQSTNSRVESGLDSDFGSKTEIDTLLERLKLAFETRQNSLRNEYFNPEKNDVCDHLQVVSENINIPISLRVEYLNKIRNLANTLIDNIEPKVPSEAPAFWKDRGSVRRSMSPCDFVRENYPSYGFSLTQADIRKLDPQLYVALHNVKKKFGWPKDFALPTKSEFLRQIE